MKKLTKSSDNRMVSGVLGGIAEYLNVDSTVVRVIYVVLVLFGQGFPILLYFILAMVLPESNIESHPHGHGRRGPGGPGGGSYGSYYGGARPRKEAKPVDKEEDNKEKDDWSDF